VWIESLATRRRKPVKPATVDNWRHSLDKWILPTLGDRLVADVSNAALRELVEKMSAAGLAAKSIVNHAQVVCHVVASAVNAEGEQLYPRTWNYDFIGLPVVQRETQKRQTTTATELEAILANANSKRDAVLHALLAGTGIRIGEALGLKFSDLSPDCRVLHVERSIYKVKEQTPKSPNAVRDVDIPEPLANVLREYAAGKSGYLFCTASGKPLIQRNALRALHKAAGRKVGFHALRRFRTETLRRARVPEDLIRYWMAHQKQSITDFYADGLKNDVEWRRQWCDTVGLGFGLQGLQKVVPIDSVKAA
jgi:integrase